MANWRIPIIPILLSMLLLSSASAVLAARDRRIQKQDRSRQMRILVGELDRMSDLNAGALAANRPRLDAAINDLLSTYDQVAVKLKPARQKKIRRQIEQLVTGYRQGAAAKVIGTQAAAIRRELLDALKVNTTPVLTPDFANGQKIYDEHCAVCHGAKGVPPEALAKKLRPPPADLSRSDTMQAVSPFRVYNDLLVGIPGTAKKAFVDVLADEELWNVAFYSLTLRHLGAAGDDPKKLQLQHLCQTWPKAAIPSPPMLVGLRLADVSMMTERELEKRLINREKALAYTRLCLSFAGSLPR